MRFSRIPYISSGIAVLFIICILVAQYFIAQQANEPVITLQEPMTDQDADRLSGQQKEEIIEKINQYINEKIAQSHKQEEYIKIEAINSMQRAIEQVTTNVFTFYNQAEFLYQGDKQNSEGIVAGAKNYLDFQLSMPVNNLEQFKSNGSQWFESEKQLISIIDKQEEVSEQLLLYWQQHNLLETALEEIYIGKLVPRLNNFNSIKNSEVRKYAQYVHDNGLMFVNSEEGEIDIVVDYNWMQRNLFDHLTTEMNDYFSIMQQMDILNDGALTVSWNELSNRIVQLEDFMLWNPTFEKSPDLHEYYYKFLTYYIFGVDNSPVFDETGSLNYKVKESYQRFMLTYDNQQTLHTIKEYYSILEQHQFNRSEASTSFVINGLSQQVPLNSKVNSNVEHKLFPLSAELNSIYEKFSSSYDEQLLKGLSALDVMRLYVHAAQTNNSEVNYELYFNDENYYLPSKSEYLQESKHVPESKWSEINEDIVDIVSESFDNDEEVIKLILQSRDEPVYFQMRRNKGGIWKVSWLPSQ
ncbi:hypothetical protein [Bacillus solimangrovi]|uniref:hypothetical protein n=1 Tax=Bacillus solimangrovi TaxID=1305675 RepID=UPI000B06595C|nr:hypothetical protein [Bacillus solimangrovi]